MKKIFTIIIAITASLSIAAADRETAIFLYQATLNPAKCAVNLGNGSERGGYVNQDYILQKLGRPHRCVQLMYCYYPLDKGWPRRASEAFKTTDTKNAWGYPYDDYFPYKGGLGGNTKGEPFTFMRDIRRHGQDVSLTLTIDCGVSDEHLIQIARDLKPFGNLRLRINHEATGTWFEFTKRYSYQQVADFFVRFHKIIKKEAPNVKTIICIGGIKGPTDEIKCEKEFTEALQVADIWSVDRYIALHWGWPHNICEPGDGKHKVSSVDKIHDLNSRSFARFKFLNNGKAKPTVLSELNADADVTGGIGQAKIVKEFYDKIKDGSVNCYSSITMYQFRDGGRLGLEQEDPNNPEVGIEQPLLKTYREIIADPYFQPTVTVGKKLQLPIRLRWGGSENADGVSIPVTLTKHPVFFEATFTESLNLMIQVNGHWFYKAPGVKTVDLMPAFWNKKVVDGSTLNLTIFAPPASGENDASQGNDWNNNYYTQLTELPKFRIRYRPTKVAK